jgi:hypothetical protein
VDLAAAMRADGIAVSPSTVRRWLAEDALKPWQHQSWIFRRDPEFEAKAAVVLDLYSRQTAGTRRPDRLRRRQTLHQLV